MHTNDHRPVANDQKPIGELIERFFGSLAAPEDDATAVWGQRAFGLPQTIVVDNGDAFSHASIVSGDGEATGDGDGEATGDGDGEATGDGDMMEPYRYVQIDHTVMDIEIVGQGVETVLLNSSGDEFASSSNPIPIGRPYLTMLMERDSGVVLAYDVTYNLPTPERTSDVLGDEEEFDGR